MCEQRCRGRSEEGRREHHFGDGSGGAERDRGRAEPGSRAEEEEVPRKFAEFGIERVVLGGVGLDGPVEVIDGLLNRVCDIQSETIVDE